MFVLSPPTVPEGMADASMLLLVAFAANTCPVAMQWMNVIAWHHELLRLILSPEIYKI